MIIKDMELKNFGKFSGKSLDFGEGLNVIYGKNGSGKTTIYTAIGALLFGMERQRGRAARNDDYSIYQPWENRTWYEGSLRFETGGKVFLLERSFYQGEKTAGLVCETDGEELSVEQGDLEILLGIDEKEIFYNTAAAGAFELKPQKAIFGHLKNYIANAETNGNYAADVVKALSILENRKKLLEKEEKKKIQELKEKIAGKEAGKVILEEQIRKLQASLEQAVRLEESQSAGEERGGQSFWQRLLDRIKQILFRKRIRKERERKKEEALKLKEKISLQKETLGEQEASLEELCLEIDRLYEKIQEASESTEAEAVAFAIERIKEVSSAGSREILNRLQKKASEVLKEVTEQRFEGLFMEEDGQLRVWDGRRSLQMFQVSTGEADQIYLSLRIALQDLFFEEEALPLMFDDAFVYFDEERLKKLLCCLAGQKRQVFLFSCHRREQRILKELGIPYREICL